MATLTGTAVFFSSAPFSAAALSPLAGGVPDAGVPDAAAASRRAASPAARRTAAPIDPSTIRPRRERALIFVSALMGDGGRLRRHSHSTPGGRRRFPESEGALLAAGNSATRLFVQTTWNVPDPAAGLVARRPRLSAGRTRCA